MSSNLRRGKTIEQIYQKKRLGWHMSSRTPSVMLICVDLTVVQHDMRSRRACFAFAGAGHSLNTFYCVLTRTPMVHRGARDKLRTALSNEEGGARCSMPGCPRTVDVPALSRTDAFASSATASRLLSEHGLCQHATSPCRPALGFCR